MYSSKNLPQIFQEGQEKFQKALFQDSIRHFQYCIHQGYEIRKSLFYLGLSQFYQLSLRDAFVSFQAVISVPGYIDSLTHYYLGTLCELLGNKVDAVMYYKRSIDEASDSLSPLMSYRALSFYEKNESYKIKALNTFEIQLEISVQEKFLIEAFQALIKDDMEEAQEAFILAKEENKAHFEPYLYLAQFYWNWGNAEDALKYWEFLEKKFHISLLGLLPRMKLFYKRGEYKKALNFWKVYKKWFSYPGEREYFFLGLLYSRTGQIVKAISAYARASILDPSSFSSFFNLGVSLHKKGDFQGALTAYEAALALEPNNPFPPYNMGLVYFEQKNYVRAIYYLERASLIDPNFQEAKDNTKYITYLHMLDDRTFYQRNRKLLFWIIGILFVLLLILTILHFVGAL